MRRCVVCGGAGLVYVDIGRDGDLVEQLRECRRCGGTGEEECPAWLDVDEVEMANDEPNDRMW